MIVIDQAHLRTIGQAAEHAYPCECCGLLIGRRSALGWLRVSGIAPSANVDPRPRNCFEVDPALRLRLMCQLRGSDEAIVGHYHSHPDAPAVPSAHDIAMAFEPQLIWLIVSVERGRAGPPAAFRCEAAGGYCNLPLSSCG